MLLLYKKKRRRNESPEGDDHIPFLIFLQNFFVFFLCRELEFASQQPRWAVLKIFPFGLFRTQLLKVVVVCYFPPPTAQRWGWRRVWNADFMPGPHRSLSRIEEEEKKKVIRSLLLEKGVHSYTQTHKTQMLLHRHTFFFFGTSTTENKTTRRPFFFRLIWSLMHENRDFYDQQLLKYMQNNLKNLERLQKLVLICSLCVCLGYSGTNESGTRSELT